MTEHLRNYLLARRSINAVTGCWEWVGPKDRDGYGKAHSEGRTLVAHRAAYEVLVGPIPAGLTLDHLCRNRACINPTHLEPVTLLENVNRSPLRRFNVETHCAQGHEYTDKSMRIRSDNGRIRRICLVCRQEQYRQNRINNYEHVREMERRREARKRTKQREQREANKAMNSEPRP